MVTSGLYEKLVTEMLSTKLDADRFYIGERKVEAAEASVWLSRSLSKVIGIAIDSIPNSPDRVQQQVELANSFIKWISENIQNVDLEDNLIAAEGKILEGVLERVNPVAPDLAMYLKEVMPQTGLSQSELFCGSNAGLSLESEIKREIRSADEIYWLVSFIKWAGIRIFKKELEEFARSGKSLKIITTSYMGATDARAVEYLAGLPNVEVKLSYNTDRERLHAKSYLFLRNIGFHTGYIGSSNLSRSALTNGLEWNLKITSQEIPHIIDKSIHTFETYWESPEFECFDNGDTDKEKLRTALSKASGNQDISSNQFFFDIKPYHHQQAILDKVEYERSYNKRYKNLIVAATGTGKTIISALDFKRFYAENPECNFLFIAHRVEILKQARTAYRGVLRNSEFGELYGDGNMPNNYKHLFASIQTINRNLDELNLSGDYYDYIVIDEVHHISANSYRKLLEYFTPKILLGLTATPERHDGANILNDFCGVIAAEIRLPEAINQRHLCPFQYFAIDDETDLRKIAWSNGKYDVGQLTHLYTHNDQRVNKILLSMDEIITDTKKIKALGFCVSQEHAEYMAKKFNLAGIASAYLTANNSEQRTELQQSLRLGDIQVLFVVDIFNEGVDIPELDTLLFLRPTESLTIFLQQLGRGLRLTPEKECCTILDFVGNSRPEYDYTQKFRAVVGKTDQSIKKEIEGDFPNLPLGCAIDLQRRAKEIILTNIRNAIVNSTRLIELIKNYSHNATAELNLANFLSFYENVSLENVYKVQNRGLGGWNYLLEASGHSKTEALEDVRKAYYRAISNRLLGCESRSYFEFITELIDKDFNIQLLDLTEEKKSFALMCHYDFWGKPGEELGFNTLEDSLKALNVELLKNELQDVIEILLNRLDKKEVINEAYPVIGLHSRHPKDHIMVAYGKSTWGQQTLHREGVLNLAEQNTELLFVTLNKSEEQFTPTTMYHDYAISDELFHWQSQNSARPDTGKGLSYVQQRESGQIVILFVREKSKDENGRTKGFINLGEGDFVKYENSQPMDITWKLKNKLPAYLWQDAAKLAVGS
ncbi:DUF3427 domain-containing protein [Kangiella japonica]|uniref:DUF3427 domain-containing protein n=1 Tax=Kangiella japonica TaxID=647384 RepID=A0ABN0SYM0_9GAMM